MAESVLPAKPAATVMLLRDADTDEGIEVFMLRRTTAAAFAGGMYVFPGGKVDPADGEGDVAYVVAAIRECYEEAGVLLATDKSGVMIADGHPALAHRQAVYDGAIDLRELCTQHQLRPALDDLVWISHWITPAGESPRRFDTTSSSRWPRPNRPRVMTTTKRSPVNGLARAMRWSAASGAN